MIMGLLSLFTALLGCSKADLQQPDNANDIPESMMVKSLYFNVSGSYPGFSYEIHPDEKNPEKTVMKFIDGSKDFKEVNKKVDSGTMGQVSMLCENLDIKSWDNFNEVNEGVLDGSGFVLQIEYEDGTKVRAEGDNSFPKNYQEFERGIRAILEKL